MIINNVERNIEALKEVRERVLADKLYMSSWLAFGMENRGPVRHYHRFIESVLTEEIVEACDTRACLAGWAIINQAVREQAPYRHVLAHYGTETSAGAHLLGLDHYTAGIVFTETWPLGLLWTDPDHQLAMIDGLIAGWYINDAGVWCTADGEPLTTDAL